MYVPHHNVSLAMSEGYIFTSIFALFNAMILHKKPNKDPLAEFENILGNKMNLADAEYITNKPKTQEFIKAIKYCPEIYSGKLVVVTNVDNIPLDFINHIVCQSENNEFTVVFMDYKNKYRNKFKNSPLSAKELGLSVFNITALTTLDLDEDFSFRSDTFF